MKITAVILATLFKLFYKVYYYYYYYYDVISLPILIEKVLLLC